MTREAVKIPGSSSPWRSVVAWLIGLLLLVFMGITAADLISRLRPHSFAVMYPENAARNTLLLLLGAVGLIAIASYVGKLYGERSRQGRKISYWAIMGDQLTHLFFWIVILIALYPIVFVLSASFDPRNTLMDSSFGETGPLIVRARVLPGLEDKDFSNYIALFNGVSIEPWQWAGLGVFALGILSIAMLWFLVQGNAGVTSPALARNRTRAYWAIAFGLALFFLTLSPGQFHGENNETRFLLWLRNTFIISSSAGVLTVLLTTTVGYAMARLRFPGRFEMLLFFIFIQMFPGMLGAVAIYDLMYRLGLLNNLTGLILALSGGSIAYGTWIYKGYVESLPPSLEEAALVDGCTRWTAFTKVVLPLSGPMLVFIFLMQFIGAYAEFFFANILLASGADNWNIGVGLRSFVQNQFSTEFGKLSATAVLGSLPIVALFYGFQQFFVSGTLSGGVKE